MLCRLAVVCAGLALSACTIEPIPWSITPREMVLPYLQKECLRAPARANGVKVVSAGDEPRLTR